VSRVRHKARRRAGDETNCAQRDGEDPFAPLQDFFDVRGARPQNKIVNPAPTKTAASRAASLAAVAIALFCATSCADRANSQPKPQDQPLEFVSEWGIKGDGPGQLDGPVALATDVLGDVYFADRAAGYLHKFEPDGTPLLSLEDARFRRAAGVAVDRGGAMYIADPQGGHILIYFPNGDFLRALRMPSQRKFTGALGICVDDDGNLYVPDPAGGRVEKLDSRGRVARLWAVRTVRQAKEDPPTAVAVGPDGSVFVAYSQSGKIEKFLPPGKLAASWSITPNSVSARTDVTSIAIWGQSVITASSASPHLRVWTLDGERKLEDDLGSRVGANGDDLQIAASSRGDLFVLDPSGPRVLRFHIHF